MLCITLRALALMVLYLLAVAGLTVLVEPLGAFVLAFGVTTAGYVFVCHGLVPGRRP